MRRDPDALSCSNRALAAGLVLAGRAGGSCEPWHQTRTLTLAGRAVVRPVDAMTTATAVVVPFAFACDDSAARP